MPLLTGYLVSGDHTCNMGAGYNMGTSYNTGTGHNMGTNYDN